MRSYYLCLPLFAFLFAACELDKPGESTAPLEGGFCAPSCPKSCQQDTECDTPNGELCCDFGGGDKICSPAASCPRFCNKDSQCDTDDGEGCIRPSLLSELKVCQRPELAVKTCGGDSECDTAKGESCCTIYKEPICLPAESCPKACDSSDQCDTGKGQICCTSLPSLDKTLGINGLCVDPKQVPCPTPCQESKDCSASAGELCCNGFCSTSCARSCQSSTDCKQQICCKAAAAQSPFFGSAAPSPGYTTCSCQGSETRCLDSKTLASCTGCNFALKKDCQSYCQQMGYTTGSCVSGYEPDCECSDNPYPPQAQNSGQSCDSATPCPGGDTCIHFSPTASKGICTASCATYGDICPTASSANHSICGIPDPQGNGSHYCAFICEIGSQSYPCPDVGQSCLEVSAGLKVCQPQ